MARLLLVEDEPAIADTVAYALRGDGHEVVHRMLGREALALAGRERFDLAILDVGLPDIDGFALCRDLRRGGALPVIFLTAHGSEVERVLGLELGADDYVVKPFSPLELAAQVRAVLRRTTQAQEGAEARAAATVAGFQHDTEGHRIHYHGRALDLTRYEYGLLAALLARPGAVLSRAQLMERVWGDAPDTSDRTVDTHVKTLRAKLREVAPDEDPIRTHRGLGYSV